MELNPGRETKLLACTTNVTNVDPASLVTLARACDVHVAVLGGDVDKWWSTSTTDNLDICDIKVCFVFFLVGMNFLSVLSQYFMILHFQVCVTTEGVYHRVVQDLEPSAASVAFHPKTPPGWAHVPNPGRGIRGSSDDDTPPHNAALVQFSSPETISSGELQRHREAVMRGTTCTIMRRPPLSPMVIRFSDNPASPTSPAVVEGVDETPVIDGTLVSSGQFSQ